MQLKFNAMSNIHFTLMIHISRVIYGLKTICIITIMVVGSFLIYCSICTKFVYEYLHTRGIPALRCKLHYIQRQRGHHIQTTFPFASVVNKDLSFKVKAKAMDLTSEQVQGPL